MFRLKGGVRKICTRCYVQDVGVILNLNYVYLPWLDYETIVSTFILSDIQVSFPITKTSNRTKKWIDNKFILERI